MKRKSPPVYLDDAEREALFRVIKNPRDRAIFELAYWRGLRASEPGLLRLEDWRPKTGRLYVRRLKGSTSQDYLLTPREQKALKAWVRVRGKVPGLLFPGYGRKGLSGSMTNKLMHRYAALAELPKEKRHFHVLKHSIGTHLGNKREPLVLIQDHLGHADVRSTMVYVHVPPAVRDELAERLAA